MKEINPPQPDKLKVSEQRQIEKTAIIGTLQPKRGQKCYELNLLTGQVTEAIVQSSAFHYSKDSLAGGTIVKKVVIRENCMYVCAINPVNAQKKIFQHPQKIALRLQRSKK